MIFEESKKRIKGINEKRESERNMQNGLKRNKRRDKENKKAKIEEIIK